MSVLRQQQALGAGSSRSPTPDRTRSAQIRGIVQFQRLLIRLRSANATIDRGIPSSDRIEKRVITLSHRNRSCRNCKEPDQRPRERELIYYFFHVRPPWPD